MDKVKLEVKIRDVFGRKTEKGKKGRLIPAVVYGRELESKSLWVDALKFRKLLKEAGESTIIELDVDGKEKRNVIIYETQKDPVSGRYIHADFFQVRMDEEIETEVELVYVGEPLAVKELGGVLVKNMDEITVRCLPADLPSEIKVDVSGLKTFEDYVYARDLKISPKVKIDLDPGTVIALVSPPRSEEELESLSEKVEEDVSKVEGVVKEPVSSADGETPEKEDKEEISEKISAEEKK